MYQLTPDLPLLTAAMLDFFMRALDSGGVSFGSGTTFYWYIKVTYRELQGSHMDLIQAKNLMPLY